MNSILNIVLWLVIFHSQAANLSDANPQPKFKLPPNHQSIYQIEKYNTDVGEMKNTLDYHDGIIHYSSIAEAKGIATFFFSAAPTELSLLSWPENMALTFPQQQSFNFVQEKDHKKNQHIEFKSLKTDETLIEGSYKYKSYSLTTNKKVWSRQLLLLLISSDFQLNPNRNSNSFFITDKGQINKYTYTVLTDTSVEYHNKPLPAVKVKIIKEDSNRMSYVWLSKTQYFLPLIIEQYKNNDLNVRMQLTQLKLK